MSEKKKTNPLRKYILPIWTFVLKCSYSFWNGVYQRVVRPICKSICRHIPTWILAIVALSSLCITYRNNELVNRPFLSIEDVNWSTQNILGDSNQNHFCSSFTVKNCGDKPAENYTLKNVRAIILNVNEPNLYPKLKQESKDAPKETLDSLLPDLRYRVHEWTANILAKHFRDFPYANKADGNDFVDSWAENLPEYEKVKYNNKLLVKYIDGNNDMNEYLSKTTIIYPTQMTEEKVYQPMSKEALNGVITKGDNFLVLYWIIEYKGQIKKLWPLNIWPLNKFWPSTPKTYSTCYVGYYSKWLPGESNSTDQIVRERCERLEAGQ